MRRDESCKIVCRRKLSQEAAKNFKEKIDDEYRVNMYGFMLKLLLF
jgi:transmembrane 9 superfamily protein 2/4